MAAAENAEPAWLHGHPHEPNPELPPGDGSIRLLLPGGEERLITPTGLQDYPFTEVGGCFIVSTGHGTSGPFVFGGVRLADLLAARLPTGASWSRVDVISSDGFGTRIKAADLAAWDGERPPLLSCRIDGAPMTRRQGLVRLVVPTEVSDALRQVKWVAQIRVS